ncbi:MAG: response regulator transcription factor [Chloroflexota bacterium]
MKRVKVLIVDDDANFAVLIEARLKAAGYEAITANSAAEAYQTFASFKPDLVLTDIGIGEENGLDLVKRIRSQSDNIRTIYMTGDLARYHAALVQEKLLHHVEVMAKPFNGSQLIAVVSAQTRSQQQAGYVRRRITDEVDKKSSGVAQTLNFKKRMV